MDKSDKALIQLGKATGAAILITSSVMLVPKIISNKKLGVSLAIIGFVLGTSLFYSAVRNFPKRDAYVGP